MEEDIIYYESDDSAPFIMAMSDYAARAIFTIMSKDDGLRNPEDVRCPKRYCAYMDNFRPCIETLESMGIVVKAVDVWTLSDIQSGHAIDPHHTNFQPVVSRKFDTR